MVIPVGGMGPQLQGPPPPELRRHFLQLKICVLLMFSAMIGKLVAGLLLWDLPQMLMNSLNLIMNTILGIFLLKDDPHIVKIYMGLISTFQICAQCGGGMTCLMPFVICNFITVLLDLLGGSAMNLITQGTKVLFNPSACAGRAGQPLPQCSVATTEAACASLPAQGVDCAWQTASFLNTIALGLFIFSVILALVAQLVGTCVGYMAYKEAIALAPDDGNNPMMGGMGGPPGGNFGQGLGRPLMQPPQQQRAPWAQQQQQQQQQQRAPQQPRTAQQQSFVPFGGQGRSLGSS